MANLTLRVVTNPGDTTKGAPLTSSEVDQNFINLDNELATKAPSLEPEITRPTVVELSEFNNGSASNGWYEVGMTASPSNDFVVKAKNSSGVDIASWVFDGTTGALTSSGDVDTLSDSRVKTDVEKIGNALEKVGAINGYTFTRTDTGKRQTGVIAQEVQAVLPEAVSQGEVYLTVAYGNMVGLLVEAIKELKAEVDSLRAQVSHK